MKENQEIRLEKQTVKSIVQAASYRAYLNQVEDNISFSGREISFLHNTKPYYFKHLSFQQNNLKINNKGIINQAGIIAYVDDSAITLLFKPHFTHISTQDES